MTQDERILELVEIIHQQGKVTQEFICQRYGISYDSARRDLLKLGQMTGILRVRGGAISQPPKLAGRSYRQRSEPDAIKLRLARYAASLIQPPGCGVIGYRHHTGGNRARHRRRGLLYH